MQASAATVVAQLEMERAQRGMDKNELAALTGWSAGTLYNIVKRPETVKLSQLIDIAEALDVEISVQIDKKLSI